ncbi:uncharacterized protein H6S33_010138 [Morchella sextelata]|uniref:uncharacterized protein n=1 Tax=Morchella sextelata TaxID=1174677 RepID=UPI001D050F3C|nr:uncharacterized protein H6S33_010138 [Morchella sextelata]KAH0612086.1 hypothetical protein H6S33_010138 [Morchella sextelata]
MLFGTATVFVSLLLPSLGLALPRPQLADDALATFVKRATPVAALEAGFAEIEASKTEVSIAAVASVRNDLTDGGCDDIIVIFARGTSGEGNVGVATSVGPIFFGNLSAAEPGRVIVQGVNDYPATVLGYLGGGSDEGAEYMAEMVTLASTQCPGSKVVLSGFSQGAQVTHKAGKLIPANLYSTVAAIVLFGDPDNGDAFPGTLNNNVKTFCHDGDYICDGLPIITDQHGNYANDAPAAAAYVAARV